MKPSGPETGSKSLSSDSAREDSLWHGKTRWTPTLWGAAGTGPRTKDNQRVEDHRIPSRPHLQGGPLPLRREQSTRKLTDGAGLVLGPLLDRLLWRIVQIW